jgi:phosphate transport system substrate-binding protein
MKSIKNLLVLSLLLIFVFTGCSTEQKDSDNTDNQGAVQDNNTGENSLDETTETVEDTLKGEVTISGSTSVEKIGKATALEFEALHPGVTVTYEGIGSSSGIKNANEGTSMIGTASRNLKEEEKSWGMNEVAIAYDGVAVISHPSNNIEGLTMDQVQGIFKGEITNWSQVGGDDEEIVVVSRENGSGTRGAFEELVGFEDELTENAIIAEGNGNVQTTVAGNEKAIGYVSFTYINETVKPLLVDEVEPTTENVLSGEYGISRPFLMVYHDENMNDVSKEFINFVLSEDGQMIVEDKGGIPVK